MKPIDLRKTKIRVINKTDSNTILYKLQTHGVEWYNHNHYQNAKPYILFLFIDENLKLTSDVEGKVFNNHSYKEIFINDSNEFEFVDSSTESKGHPHSDLLMKYAEISKTDSEPWNHFEYYSGLLNKWCQMRKDDRLFRTDYHYRLKKDFKKINGHKIPNITFTPKNDQEFIAPAINVDLCLHGFSNTESRWVSYYIENDMCYPNTEEGKAAAVLHSKALMDYSD